jgi:hypothetical protein
VAAEVVGAALHVADAQVAEERLEKGHVAEEELVLEGLGAGGDDDALAGAQGGQQVGEGFAGAGAGFDDQMAALGEGALDGLGHFKLAGAVLIGQRGAERIPPGEKNSWRLGRDRIGASEAGIGRARERRFFHHSERDRQGTEACGFSS